MGLLQLILGAIVALLSLIVDFLSSINICPVGQLLQDYVAPAFQTSPIMATLIRDFVPLGTIIMVVGAWLVCIPVALIIRFILKKVGII